MTDQVSEFATVESVDELAARLIDYAPAFNVIKISEKLRDFQEKEDSIK